MTTLDTDPAAGALQLQIQRAMPGEQRLLLAFEMSLFARELTKAGIRRDHPDWDEERVARELLRLAFLPAPLPPALRFAQIGDLLSGWAGRT